MVRSIRYCIPTPAAATPSIRFNSILTHIRQIQSISHQKFDPYTRLLNLCKLFQTRQLFDEIPLPKFQPLQICKIIHAQTIQHGFASDTDLGNAILDLYAKCGHLHYAQITFDRLLDKNVFSWNSILSLYSRCGLAQKIPTMFGSMMNADANPNQFTFALVLSACSKLVDIRFGKKVHCYVMKLGFLGNSFCQGALIDMYAKCDFLIEARKIFDQANSLDTVSWTSMIAGYVRVDLPEEAIKLFNDMKMAGVTPDQVAFVTVINACVRLGKLADAVDLFAEMPQPNVVAWNVMISGHAQSGYSVEAIDFYQRMRRYGVKPTRSSLGSVLSAIAIIKAVEEGQQVHAQAIRMGLDSNVYVGSALTNMYAKSHMMESARNVFDALDEKNTVLWNTMLGGYAQNGHHFQVMQLFSDMRAKDLQPDGFTYTSVFSACACLQSLDAGKQLHGYTIKCNLESNLYVGNAMVDMYAKSGDLRVARKLFELIQFRDNISWNAIIVGYVHEQDEEEAFNMFRRMNFDRILPDQVSLSSILSACANLQALEPGKQLHCYSLKSGFDMNVYAGSSLVDMYAKCGLMEAANTVIARMPEKTVVSRNALIAGYVQNNNVDEAMNLFQEMLQEGLRPTKFTFASMLSAGSGSLALHLGKQVHCQTLKSGILHEDDFLGVSLLGVYLTSDGKDDANKLFLEFTNNKSKVLWTAIISGHAQNGYSEDALWLFKAMRIDDVLPDQATFVSILSACASLTALKEGRQVHSLIVQIGFNLDEHTCSALVDMYAKCGEVRDSFQVFKEMESKKYVISWNSMIVGFAKNGYAEESLEIFDQMRNTRIEPDDVTLLGVLTACSHSGMVSEGLQYFEDMINDYGIRPRSDHYACMIDLLGRGGRLNEAEEFIKSLPVEADAMIWSSFLSACRLHGDDVRGQHAAEKLIQLEPQNSSHYTLLSNIYAASQNWDGVNMVRKSMREMRVSKLPGCSWIVVGNKMDVFVAGDKSHASAGDIRALLKDLSIILKVHGYVVPTDSILLDED